MSQKKALCTGYHWVHSKHLAAWWLPKRIAIVLFDIFLVCFHHSSFASISIPIAEIRRVVRQAITNRQENSPVPVQPVLEVGQGELVARFVLPIAWTPPLNSVVGEVNKLNENHVCTIPGGGAKLRETHRRGGCFEGIQSGLCFGGSGIVRRADKPRWGQHQGAESSRARRDLRIGGASPPTPNCLQSPPLTSTTFFEVFRIGLRPIIVAHPQKVHAPRHTKVERRRADTGRRRSGEKSWTENLR